jgi:hypothetical protein
MDLTRGESMAETERVAIAPCPNPKCGKPIWMDHNAAWCYQCGEYFPQEFAARLPQLTKRLGTRAQPVASETPSKAMESASPRARAVMDRYRNVYQIANVIITAGDTIKGAGIVLAVIISVIGVFLASTVGMLSLLTSLIPAAAIGLGSWLSGVLLNAQGQLLLASLDGVVSITPFLTDEEKAEVMSLP